MNNPQHQRNPYIVGSVIDEPENFFGRQSLFYFIGYNLQQNTPLILLHGQRRIGKSSVLKQIPQKISYSEDQFVFIDFDIQVFVGDNQKHPINEILHYLARRIGEEIELESSLIPTAEDIEDDPTIFHENFLTQIYNILGEKKLVLLLDEFDVLSEANNEGNVEFFRLINNWLSTWPERLFIIPVVGRHLKELPYLLSFLGGSPYKEISFLDKDSAEMLITRPAQGVVTYEQNAIEEIFSLSAGHRYFTQVICYELFNLARERKIWTINAEDVKTNIDKVIETGAGGLAWFWDGFGLYPQAQVVFSAAAEAQDREKRDDQVSYNPRLLLEDYGIITDSLTQVAKQMVDYGFLNESERVIIELVRRWLLQKHQLKHEISKLAEVNQQDVENLCSVAQNQPQRALQLYEEALGINPNNFQTVTSLAKEYLQVEKFDQAFELYSRSYKFYSFYSINDQQERVLQPVFHLATEYSQANNLDKALELYAEIYKIAPEESKDGFIETLEKYAHDLTIKQDLARARQQYERVLQIDPNRQYFLIGRPIDYRESLFGRESIFQLVQENLQQSQQLLLLYGQRRIGKSSIILSIPQQLAELNEFVFVTFELSLLDSKRELKISSSPTPDNNTISRGDKTLFPNVNNIFRDQGIAAFKNGNYQEAVNLFDQAVKANPYDPEVLIYYNNARASQNISSVSLAVVVPIDSKTNNDNAQEILRGVAQAQNQFNDNQVNDNQGSNGLLLKVVIANDSNNPEEAKQVVEEIVKDDSILGVIGHNSSDVTEAVIPAYKKAGLAIISSTATSNLLKSSVFFRVVDSDEIAGKKLAQYSNSLGFKKVVIFNNPNSAYSKSITKVFTNEFEKMGGKVLLTIDLSDEKFDPREEVITGIDEFQAEAAILFPDTEHTNSTIEIAKANKELNNNSPLGLLGGHTLYSNDTLIKGGKAVEGMILSVPWFRETSQAKDFADKSGKEWGGGISWRTATSFDATQAFIQALSKDNTQDNNRANVLERLQKVKLNNKETSGYALQFTKERERQGQSVLVEVKNGKFTMIP